MARFWAGRFWGLSSGGSAPVQVNTPTLSIVDNANGTGGVATIGNATAGTTNTINGADWSGGLVGGTQTVLGSRSGNGTVALAVANGYHWAQVFSTDGSTSQVSAVVYYRTTSGSTALFYQILLAVQAKIQAMTLTGLSSADVYLRKLAIDRNITHPCVFVSPATERQDPKGGTNNRDDVGYGVNVAIAQASNGDMTSNHARLLMWREQINRAFRNARLPGLEASNYTCQVEPGPVVWPEGFAKQFDITALTLRFFAREIRGVQ